MKQPKVQPFEKVLIILVSIIACLVVIAMAQKAVRTHGTTEALGNAHSRVTVFSLDDYKFDGFVYIRFGDCFADHASGDIYTTENPFCLTGEAEETSAVMAVKHAKNDTTNNVEPQTVEPPIVEPPSLPVAPVEPVEPPVVTPPTVTPPTVTPPTVEPPVTPEDTAKGNPGNTKSVGNAGEDPNGKGTMPLDNAGGNGNGEHGNQGQGGNH